MSVEKCVHLLRNSIPHYSMLSIHKYRVGSSQYIVIVNERTDQVRKTAFYSLFHVKLNKT